MSFAFEVKSNRIGAPTQLPIEGVTVIVAVELSPLAIKDEIIPVPFAASPIDGVEFVQTNVFPTPPIKSIR